MKTKKIITLIGALFFGFAYTTYAQTTVRTLTSTEVATALENGTEIAAGADEEVEVTLEDGTVIRLSPGAKLTLSKDATSGKVTVSVGTGSVNVNAPASSTVAVASGSTTIDVRGSAVQVAAATGGSGLAVTSVTVGSGGSVTTSAGTPITVPSNVTPGGSVTPAAPPSGPGTTPLPGQIGGDDGSNENPNDLSPS